MILNTSLMYNLNYSKLISWLLPELQPNTYAFVNALITPVRILLSEFQSARNQDWYLLNHNGQVCYLRKTLNDGFDNTERRITITDGFQYVRKYEFTRAEEKPVYRYTRTEENPVYLNDRSDYEGTSVDFIVNVPVELEATINEVALKARINLFKLASKRYKILYYE